MAAVLLPIAALGGVGQTEDQLEGLDPQLNTDKARGNNRMRVWWEAEGRGQGGDVGGG